MNTQAANPDVNQISTFVPGQAEYESAAGALGVDNPDYAQLLPFGIVIRNTGGKALVAYHIRWIFDGGTGSPIVKEQTYMEAFALKDGASPGKTKFSNGIAIFPDKARLVTPAFNRLVESKNKSPRPPTDLSHIRQALSKFLSYEQQQPFKGVKLVAYVLDDGICVNRSNSDLCTILQAKFDSMQDLYQVLASTPHPGDNRQYFMDVTSSLTKVAARRSREDLYQAIYEPTQTIWMKTFQQVLLQKTGGYTTLMNLVRPRIYSERPVTKTTMGGEP